MGQHRHLEDFWAACMRDRGSGFSFWNEENTYFLKGVGEIGNDGKKRAVVGRKTFSGKPTVIHTFFYLFISGII